MKWPWLRRRTVEQTLDSMIEYWRIDAERDTRLEGRSFSLTYMNALQAARDMLLGESPDAR